MGLRVPALLKGARRNRMFPMRGSRILLGGLGLCVGAALLVHLWVGLCLGKAHERRQLEELGSSAGLLPHIDKCNFCQKCQLEKLPPEGIEWDSKTTQDSQTADLRHSKSEPKDGTKSKNSHSAGGGHGTKEKHWTGDDIVKYVDRSHLPNCTECRGCHHRLELMSLEQRAFGRTFKLKEGHSAARLLMVSGENVPGGRALVKVYCLPLANVRSGDVHDCPSSKHIWKSHQITNAVQKIGSDCGLGHMIPKSWVAHVKGVIEGLGIHVDATALWMNIVDGISLNYILTALEPDEIHDLLSNHINSTEVAMTAAFDLLTSQCDRHDENVFFTDSGKMSIIDHDSSLGQNWRPCGIDSIFLPSTQKYHISHLGYYFIMKQERHPRRSPSPTLMLDYRCHVAKHVIGVDYPPPFQKCLLKIRNMSVKEAMVEYGLPKRHTANVLLDRAEDMLRHGMEWTITNGEPQNPPSIKYGWEDPCCKMDVIRDDDDEEGKEGDNNRGPQDFFECQSRWRPSTLLPEGDPYYT